MSNKCKLLCATLNFIHQKNKCDFHYGSNSLFTHALLSYITLMEVFQEKSTGMRICTRISMENLETEEVLEL